MAERIGFIGLGIMGKPMALNLLLRACTRGALAIVRAGRGGHGRRRDGWGLGQGRGRTHRHRRDDAARLTGRAPGGPGAGGVPEGVRAGQVLVDMNFTPGFRIRLHRKDLSIALDAGKAYGVPLMATALVHEAMDSMIAQGHGDLDHSALARFVESLSGVAG